MDYLHQCLTHLSSSMYQLIDHYPTSLLEKRLTINNFRGVVVNGSGYSISYSPIKHTELRDFTDSQKYTNPSLLVYVYLQSDPLLRILTPCYNFSEVPRSLSPTASYPNYIENSMELIRKYHPYTLQEISF